MDGAPSLFGRPWAWVLFAVAVLAVPAYGFWRSGGPPPPPPPVLGVAPAFSLVSEAGAAFTEADLRGHTTVLDFIFTRCPDVCPTLSAQLAAVRRGLPARPYNGPPMRYVSITVDPAFDTPPVLAAYAERFGAAPGSWFLLTGTVEQIDTVVAGFQQALSRSDAPAGVPDITHSQRFLLIDAEGRLRAFHETDAAGIDALVRDIEALAHEPSPAGHR